MTEALPWEGLRCFDAARERHDDDDEMTSLQASFQSETYRDVGGEDVSLWPNCDCSGEAVVSTAAVR